MRRRLGTKSSANSFVGPITIDSILPNANGTSVTISFTLDGTISDFFLEINNVLSGNYLFEGYLYNKDTGITNNHNIDSLQQRRDQ